MTAEGLQKLKDELQFLEGTERPRVIAAIAEARDKGDLSENAEYDAAKEEQGHLESKIAALKAKIMDKRGAMNEMYTQEHFFPGITTLGDILEAQGYHNVLFLGSEAVFGGRKLYFKEHGNYEIDDFNYAIKRF